MLSVVDLLDAGTLDLDLAAFLMARIGRGASFMVGARPGGAGKTTVMCALLNFVPVDVDLVPATVETVRAGSGNRRCYVCHEIGSGRYFAYLWGDDLRAYCALSEDGHQLATNLHADDVGETYDQVCRLNGVPPSHFNRFDLLVFLRVKGRLNSRRRVIEKVYVSDGTSEHMPVFTAGQGLGFGAGQDPDRYDRGWQSECRSFLAETWSAGVRTIEQVRERVVGFLKSGRPEIG